MMGKLPNSEGRYLLRDYEGESYWDVYFHPIDGKPWAYNGEQKDPCAFLGNADCTEEWEKISNDWKYLKRKP